MLKKTPAGAVKDQAALDQAISTFVTGLRGYFGGELGKSTAEGGPAGALAFTAPSADPEGARSDVPENIRRGEQMKEALRDLWDKPRSNALPTDARDEESERKPWHGTGAPHEAGLTIGDGRSRRTVADGVLNDLIRNRAIGEEWNRRLREIHGQPNLP